MKPSNKVAFLFSCFEVILNCFCVRAFFFLKPSLISDYLFILFLKLCLWVNWKLRRMWWGIFFLLFGTRVQEELEELELSSPIRWSQALRCFFLLVFSFFLTYFLNIKLSLKSHWFENKVPIKRKKSRVKGKVVWKILKLT